MLVHRHALLLYAAVCSLFWCLLLFVDRVLIQFVELGKGRNENRNGWTEVDSGENANRREGVR